MGKTTEDSEPLTGWIEVPREVRRRAKKIGAFDDKTIPQVLGAAMDQYWDKHPLGRRSETEQQPA